MFCLTHRVLRQIVFDPLPPLPHQVAGEVLLGAYLGLLQRQIGLERRAEVSGGTEECLHGQLRPGIAARVGGRAVPIGDGQGDSGPVREGLPAMTVLVDVLAGRLSGLGEDLPGGGGRAHDVERAGINLTAHRMDRGRPRATRRGLSS